MECQPLTDSNAWDKFCLDNNDSFFWHTSRWLEYTLNYIPYSKLLSFVVTENNQMIAICPLVLSERRFDMFWSPVIANVSDKKREKIADFVFSHIDELATENNVVKSSMMIYPLSFPKYNYLMKYGYQNTSLNTQVIDLTQDLSTIHSSMRKGHDYDIDRGNKILETFIFDKTNVKLLPFSSYHRMHTIDAGRETRNQRTWNLQYDWIKQGYTILLGTKYEGEWSGFSYVYLYKDKAYYGSACSANDLPNGHVLTWKAIEWLKEHGYHWYEIGLQQFSDQSYDHPSPKEIAISKFKRGFGGITIPLFRGEKHYAR